jgi:hypothetical protein
MCKQYAALFEACGYGIVRPEFLFEYPAQKALKEENVGVDSALISPCLNIERREATLGLHCHQCMLSAVMSNRRPPGQSLIDADYRDIDPKLSEYYV